MSITQSSKVWICFLCGSTKHVGMCSRYLDCLIDMLLNLRGKGNLSVALSQFTLPPRWATFQNPVTHRRNYGFTELGRMLLIAPFLLANLSASDIKTQAYSILVSMADAAGDTSRNNGFSNFKRIFVELADHVKLCLQLSFSWSDYELLHQSSITIRRTYQQILRGCDDEDARNFEKLPNIHIGMRLAEARAEIALNPGSSA